MRSAPRRQLTIALAAITVLALTGGVWAGLQARQILHRATAAGERAVTGAVLGSAPAQALAAPPGGAYRPAADTETFLLVGSDKRGRWVTSRADVIMLFILRRHGDPVMLNLPRDLFVTNPCSGKQTRINATLNGCRRTNTPGRVLLARTVTNLTGLPVHHAAQVNFDGFKQIIDAVGGIQVCVKRPIREGVGTGLLLPAGCSHVDGQMALNYVRSRHTKEFRDGAWHPAGGGDLARNRRDQEVILALLGKLRTIHDFKTLSTVAARTGDAVTFDGGFTRADALRMAWQLRGLDPGKVKRARIPVRYHRTAEGAAVLLAARPVRDVVAGALRAGEGTSATRQAGGQAD